MESSRQVFRESRVVVAHGTTITRVWYNNIFVHSHHIDCLIFKLTDINKQEFFMNLTELHWQTMKRVSDANEEVATRETNDCQG